MRDGLCVPFLINIRGIHNPSAFEGEVAIGKLKRHKFPSIDQIQVKLIIACCRTIFSLTLFGIRRKCLKSGRSLLLYPSLRRVMKRMVVITEEYHICQWHANFSFQDLAVNAITLCKLTYRESLVRISRQYFEYWSYSLYSSNNWEKTEIQLISATSIYRLQESLYS